MPDVKDENGEEVSDAMSDNGDDSETYTNDQDKMADNNGDGTGQPKKKYDPKDPHRPRRKKARRACYACQRAHLTCGKFPLCNSTTAMRRWTVSCMPFIRHFGVTSWFRGRAALQTLHQARTARGLSRWRTKEGKVPARCASGSPATSARTDLGSCHRHKPTTGSTPELGDVGQCHVDAIE